MILKIRSHDNGWAYIDGIKGLHVKHVRFTEVPVEELENESPKPTLPMMMYVIEGAHPWRKEYDEEAMTTRCFVPSEVHGCIEPNGMYPALELTLDKEEFKNIVIEEGYLLNDNGKTIDKFEPYGPKREVIEPKV